MFEYYECGICGHNHPVGWNGDCRDDANRFTDQQLDEKHGAGKWKFTDWDETPEEKEGPLPARF